jgi:tetratricopeptide (TPR) repeat protein
MSTGEQQMAAEHGQAVRSMRSVHRLVLATAAVFLTARAALPQTTEPTSQETAPQLTLDQAIDRSLELMDRFDARIGEQPSREELDELNKYILAIQMQQSDDPRVHYLYGRAWALMGKTGRAISQLDKFVATREGRLEWKAFLTRGDLYVDDFPNLAKRDYERAGELKPKEPRVLYGLSRAHFELGDLSKGLDFARQAVAEDKAAHVVFVAHLARMHVANQQWVEADRTTVTAIELAEKLVTSSPGRPGPLIVLQEQLDAIINLLRTRAQLPSGAADEFARLARYTVERADVALKLAQHEALVVLESGLRRFDSQPSTSLLEQYAVLLATVGRRDDAIEAFRKLQGVDPNNAAAKEWLLRLNAPESSAAAINGSGRSTE